MGFGLYKPGQGYWVRVLTAAFALIIVGVGGAWLAKSLGAVDPPTPTWSMTVNPAQGQTLPAAGQPVVSLGEPFQLGGPMVEVGSSEAVSVNPSATGTGQQLVVRKVKFVTNADASKVKAVAAPGAVGATPVAWGNVISTPKGKPIIERMYIQAAGVAILVLVSGIFIYRFVGAKPSSVEFLIATDGEMKKVNWSSRKDIIGSTQVVILWCVLLVVTLFCVDLMFSSFFRVIGVLQTSK